MACGEISLAPEASVPLPHPLEPKEQARAARGQTSLRLVTSGPQEPSSPPVSRSLGGGVIPLAVLGSVLAHGLLAAAFLALPEGAAPPERLELAFVTLPPPPEPVLEEPPEQEAAPAPKPPPQAPPRPVAAPVPKPAPSAEPPVVEAAAPAPPHAVAVATASPSDTAVRLPPPGPVAARAHDLSDKAPVAPSAAAQASGEGDALVGYGKRLYRQLNESIRYPWQARAMGLEGRVVVRVWVAPDGRLAKKPEVVRTSKHALLDEEALRSIEAQAPFPSLPASASGEVPFDIPIRFSRS
jgi:periplasmic protein TonB